MYLILTPAQVQYFSSGNEVKGQMMALWAKDLPSVWEISKNFKEKIIYKLNSLTEVDNIEVEYREITEEKV